MTKELNWDEPFAVKLITFQNNENKVIGVEISKEGMIYSKQNKEKYANLIKETLIKKSQIGVEEETSVRFYLNQFNLKIMEVKNQDELFDLFELNENSNNIIKSLGNTDWMSVHIICCDINKINSISNESMIEITDECIPHAHQESLKNE